MRFLGLLIPTEKETNIYFSIATLLFLLGGIETDLVTKNIPNMIRNILDNEPIRFSFKDTTGKFNTNSVDNIAVKKLAKDEPIAVPIKPL